MRSSLLYGLVLSGLIVFGVGTASAQPTFDLAVAGGGDVVGGAGVQAIELTCTMQQGGDAEGGAQGWSISLTGTGCAAITGITTDGTMAADVSQGGMRNTGFEKSEVTTGAGAGSDCEGLNGAISAVVLSFTMPITLPGESVNEIAKLAVGVTISEEGDNTGTVAYSDGCQGVGQPVENTVTWNGQTVDPSFSAAEINCIYADTCVDAPWNLIAQAEPVGQSATVNDGLLSETVDDEAAISVPVPSGNVGSADVYAAIVSDNEGGDGVQGWSLSAAVNGDVNLTGVTTEGTASADASQGGLRNTGFEKTEVVDPDSNDGQQGAVSAVVLSFTMPITLDSLGTATILCLSVESASAQGPDVVNGSIEWSDGLVGAGQPVANVATVAGATADFCTCQKLNIEFIEVEDPRNSFIRGDVNSDGKMDIADPINVVNYLFRKGPAPACADSADANDDANIDVTDVMLMINHQFRAGAAPAAPFPGCGKDGDLEDADGLGCDNDTQGCS